MLIACRSGQALPLILSPLHRCYGNLSRMTRTSMYASSLTTLTINKGTCYAVFAYDIGWSIN